MTRLELLGRPGCHLCDEGRAVLAAVVAERGGYEIAELDIESDPALLRRYLERIPVVRSGGVELAELVLEAGELHAALDELEKRSGGGARGR